MALTTGELISYVHKTYVNQGSAAIDSDRSLRNRSELNAQWVAHRVWDHAPAWFELSSADAIAISSGSFSFPSDFASMGEAAFLHVTGLPGSYLRYRSPQELFAARASNPVDGWPVIYTMYGLTSAGVYKGEVYPQGTGYTLELDGYTRNCPYLIDRPTAPSVAAGAAGALSGTYYYAVSFVTADGETELGTVSAAVALSSQKGSLTDIPVSQIRTVTARKIFRGQAANLSDAALVGTISDNVTTIYTDNSTTPAGSPATLATAVTGLEQFPVDFHETVMAAGLAQRVARKKGDVRDTKWLEEWEGELRRMWGRIQPGQAEVRAMPPFGSGLGRRQAWNWRGLSS